MITDNHPSQGGGAFTKNTKWQKLIRDYQGKFKMLAFKLKLCDDTLELPFDYVMKTNPCCLPSDINLIVHKMKIIYMLLFLKIVRLC